MIWGLIADLFLLARLLSSFSLCFLMMALLSSAGIPSLERRFGDFEEEEKVLEGDLEGDFDEPLPSPPCLKKSSSCDQQKGLGEERRASR